MIPTTLSTIGMPVEQVIPRLVVYEVLPKLEDLLMTLERLKKIWNVPQNGIPAKIVAATLANETVAGWNPKDLTRWGEALLALDEFLQSEIVVNFADGTSETATPESILLTRYTPVE